VVPWRNGYETAHVTRLPADPHPASPPPRSQSRAIDDSPAALSRPSLPFLSCTDRPPVAMGDDPGELSSTVHASFALYPPAPKAIVSAVFPFFLLLLAMYRPLFFFPPLRELGPVHDLRRSDRLSIGLFPPPAPAIPSPIFKPTSSR